MKRRTKGVLLVGSAVVATVMVIGLTVAPSLSLWMTLTRGLDHGRCPISFHNLTIGCTFTSSFSRTTKWGSVIDERSWDVTNHCPLGDVAKRLLCADASVAAPARDDLDLELSKATGLPLPKGRVITTENNSPFIKSIHVEAPLDLAAVLGFYRAVLRQRGWTENDGAVVAPDRAVIAFTTTDGPALLRLIRQNDRTIADLSLRTPAAGENTDILPSPGHAMLMLGNATDEEAVITINAQTIKLAARAGRHLADSGHKSPDSPAIDLPPGRFKVTLKVVSSAAQNREFEVGADETWGLLVGPAGVPLAVHLY
jgi:hypothetical protein